MQNTNANDRESTDIEPRTRRALERVYSVLHVDCTPIEEGESPTVVSVVSGNSGREHRVDVREEKCTCEDHEYRGVECAHIRRAKIALGRVPVHRDTLAAVDVSDRFAEHAPGPAVVTSDGGVLAGEGDGDGVDEETDTDGGRLDPGVRNHVEQHGGHDYAGVSYVPREGDR